MKKLLLHPSLKPLLMLTIVIVTVVSGFQLYSLKNYKPDVNHIELTDEKLQEISKPVPNQIIVNFTEGTTKEQRDEYVKSIGGTISSESDALNSAVVNLTEKVAVADLPKSEYVEAPEENYFVMALENPVNDPEYSNQWSLPVINAPELWSTGTQDEKVVAVIDSGICDQHPDLVGRVIEGYDFIEMDVNAFDDNGHGCSVSGIIAANSNDSIGIAGVGKNVKIMPLKVLDSLGIGTYSNVANAIVYAVDHGADIINLSLGGVNPSSILSNAISYAETNNVIVVAAAGNTGTEGVLYPAGYPYVISVGSTNEQLQQSSFSSYGPGVDILAPGEKILTTGLDDGYRYVNGTSYSAPIVSGILTMKSVSELELNEGNVLGEIVEYDENGNVTAQADPTGYPFTAKSGNDIQGFANSNCTSYVAWRINRDMGIDTVTASNMYFYNGMTGPNNISGSFSNAHNWDNRASSIGFTLTSSPRKGDIAVFEPGVGQSGTVGHVAYVESVNSDGSVNISEYNQGSASNNFTSLSYGTRNNMRASSYIRIETQDTAVDVFKTTKLYANGSNFIRFTREQLNQKSWMNLKDDSPSGFEDQIKSIKIKPGYSVGVYENYENYVPYGGQLGAQKCLKESKMNLDNEYFESSSLRIGQHISSFKVFLGDDCATQCSQSAGNLSDQACGGGTPGDGGSTNQGDSSDFITDVTIPDKTVVGLNSSFTKIWRLKNNGTSTWNAGYKLAFQSGYRLGAPTEVILNQNVSPGGTIDIAVNMISPNVGGTYRGYWKLKNSGGQLFGDQVWVEIIAQSGASTPTNTGSGQVKLFANANYANQIGAYGTGDTNHPSANSFSIEIPSGWSVKAYSSDNYSGSEACWYQSKANLTDITWNSKIQSMRVYNYYSCGGTGDVNGKVRMYAHSNYDNFVGEYGFGKTQEPNNNSKSMQIPSGWSVKTFRGNNYDGGDRCWNSSVANLEDSGWQYDIDSIDVFPTDVCPVAQADEIRLFAETGHKGAQHVLTTDIPDLGTTAIGNDNLRSWKVAYDWRMVIFEHTNYQGNSRVIDSEDNDSGEYWNYGISSVKVYKRSPNLVELFTLNNYNGDKFSIDRSIDNLIHWEWKHRPESIVVKEGYEAIICTGEGFFGNCGRTKTKHVDINEVLYDTRHNVGSIQVCKTQCPPAAATPTQVSPLNGIRFFPGTAVTMVANSDGLKYLFEISGGGQPTTNSGWISNSSFTTGALPASSSPYTWRSKSWNQYGESGWSASTEFYAIDTAISSVEIESPGTAEVNSTISLQGIVNPSDASNVVYTWSPEPTSGQSTPTATYSFTEPGNRNITLNVSNSAGAQSITKNISIICPQDKFTAEYFKDSNLSEAASSECKDTVSQDWGTLGPKNAGSMLGTGNGQNGSLIISTNTVDNPIDSAAAGTAGSTTLSATNSQFAAGQKILIHQSLGTGSVGEYQINEIQSYSAGTITLKTPLNVTYTSTSLDKAQVLVIKEYTNVTINSNTILSAKPWNGNTGGILYFMANGKVTIDGKISADAAGYRGGSATTGSRQNGRRGEGYTIGTLDVTTHLTASSAGGGGGHQNDGAGSAGGGGGHAIGGATGVTGHINPGQGGSPMGNPQLTQMFFGTGGGSGGSSYSAQSFGKGGNGGGIIGIVTNTLIVNGQITSNGQNGSNTDGHAVGAGGGGAGGSISIKAANAVLSSNKISTLRGEGGLQIGSFPIHGGAGSQGRIAVQYCDMISGTTNPIANVSQITCDKDNFSARYTKSQTFTAGTYKFTTKADDGVKVWVDSELIINEWTNGYKEKEISKTVTAGNHNIKVEYMELTGDANVNFEIEEVVAPPVINNIFTGEYFNNKTLAGTPVITNTTQVVDYGWNGSPGTGIGSDNFSVRWTGDFNFPTAGDYTFTGQGDDGIRLYVDDVLVFNGWVDQGFTKYQGVKNLTAGIHKIRYEYYEAGGGAAVTLTWIEGATICTTNPEEFCAKYYNSQTPANGSVLARRETGPINYNWGEGSPAPEVRTQDFSGKWTGKFTFNAGTYNFTHSADDGIRAWIDNVLFIDRWSGQSYSEVVTSKTMTAGLHEIRVEYLEWGGGARVKFTWEQQGGAPANIAPVVTQIPGQTKTQGQAFTTINLANYVTDSAGDTITWSYSGNTNLTVSITNNIATITAPANWTGTNNIKFRAADAGGLFAESTAAFIVNPVVAGCTQNQFSAKYFNNMTLTGTAIDAGCINSITYDWSGGSPTGVNTDNFSARYEGNHTFEAGTYTFTTLSDNGVRLYVDGVLKIDQWVSHSPQTDVVDVQLTAGTHAIKLEYFENMYSAKISLSWSLKASVGTELLTAPWNLAGNNGASEKYQTISSSALAGKTTMRITYDLHGITALGGDASAIIFDQNGWKFVSLANYGQNGLNGVQTVDIPLSAFTGLNLTTGSTTLHTRFWYGSAFTVDITSIKVF
jgi:surface antigen